MMRRILLATIGTLAAAALFMPMLANAQNSPPRMTSSQVTLSTTAAIAAIARSNRAAVTIQNHAAINIYCGPTSGVTSVNGFRLPGVDGASVTIPTSAVIYCIAASGTPVVSVLETY
jgi:hypothetical protein